MKPEDRQQIEQFLDDSLTPTEMKALSLRVAEDRDFAADLSVAIDMHGAVRAATDPDVDGVELQTRVELALGPDDRACPFTDEVMLRLEPDVARPKRHWRRVLLVAAPLWVAALLVLAFFIGAASGNNRTVATIEELPTGVMLTRNAEVREMIATDEIQTGDWIELPEGVELAFRLADGSRVVLSEGGNLQVSGEDGNHLTLLRGKIRASVEPRSEERALVVRSDCGRATVVGTIFEFSARADRSELFVEEGVVRLNEGGVDLLVGTGEHGLARRGQRPVLVDYAVRKAASAKPAAAFRRYREEYRTALIRFGPDTFGRSLIPSIPVDTKSWVKHCVDVGMDRILIEAWTPDGVRLFQGSDHRTKAELEWQAKFGDLIAATADACRAAGIRFGVSCPLTQADSARVWLPELLRLHTGIEEVHFTDLGLEATRYADWAALVGEHLPHAVVSMQESPRHAGNSVPDAPVGRYVRVSLEAPQALLMLSEVEVSSGGRIVSGGQPTQQVSTGWNGPASLAVDGNNSPKYPSQSITHTYYNDNPWWEVDLGRNHLLDFVRIWNRTDAHADHFKTYRIQIRDDDSRIVWDGWMDTLGHRSKTLDFEGGKGWRPARRHVSFRGSRYFQPVSNTQLTGGREVFLQAMAGYSDGVAPLIVVTPGMDGRIPGYEMESLMHYRALWRLAFERPVSFDAQAKVASGPIDGAWLADGARDVFWEGPEWVRDGQLEIILPQARTANALLLREPADRGSRLATAELYFHADGKWLKGGKKILAGDRIFSFPTAKVDAVKVRFKHARYAPAIEEAVLLELPQALE